jgi:hypothetical protein
MLETRENEKAPPKIFLGNGQEKIRRKDGKIFNVGTMCYDDILKIPAEHLRMAKNGKRYFKWILNPYIDGPNEYGNTHSLAVDTFKPDVDKEAFGE